MKLSVLLLLSLITLKGFSQIISGKVVDEYNKPLSEINISVNKNIGVTSDKNGHYLINIENKKSIVLKFSSVGYQTEKIRIPRLEKNQSYQLDITLFEENIILSFSMLPKSSWNIFDIALRLRSFFDVEILPLNKKALSFSFILISSDLNFIS